MKIKKYAAFLLALTLTLSGCAKNDDDTASETGDTTVTTTAAAEDNEDKSEVSVTEKAEDTDDDGETEEKEDAAKEPFSFLNLRVGDLQNINIRAEHTVNDGLPSNKYSFDFYLNDAKIISDNTAALSREAAINYANVGRKTTGALILGDKSDENPLNRTLNNTEWCYIVDNFDGVDVNAPVVVLNTLPASHFNSGNLETNHIIYSYNTKLQDVTGFIKKTAYGYYEFIPDPAYSMHLPSYHKTGRECYHTINGTGAYIDSPVFYLNLGSEEITGIDNDYVYAKMKMTATCYYDTKEGYVNDITYNRYAMGQEVYSYIEDFEIITDDVYSKMTSNFTVEEEDNAEAVKLYNVIMDNIDTLCNENTMGVVLLDLDFDGTPEIISTSCNDSSDAVKDWMRSTETKIYSVKDGGLSYIDSLYTGYSDRTLFLSTAADSKSWIFMSARDVETGEDADVDYTFTLENGKLNYTEIFRMSETKPDAESYYDRFTYYYMGEEIEFTDAGKDESNNSLVSAKQYDLADIKGSEYDIFGMIQSDYFNRFDIIHNLYTESFVYSNGMYTDYDSFTYIHPNARAISYSMAYLVDAYYEGGYSNTKDRYDYHFYGDYEKPVIYLYPEETTDVSVKVNINGGSLTCTYPDYGNGWNVTANPDGSLINSADGKEYSYLYWEGRGKAEWDMSSGFVVKGSDTAEFLQEKLAYMGLTPEEYNEFIVYWLPLMQNNEYNLIAFQQEAYTDMAELEISPAPDSMLRVFMTFMPLNEKIDIPEQQLDTFERTGFAVIEWGGSEITAAE